jgi:transcriptional regulator with XRE-family HTH domain
MSPNIDESYLLEKRYEIGKKIAELRKEKGISQSEMAELIGTKQTTISKIEAGKWNFSIDFINAILLKLDLRVEFL